jgi:hypothetical protein
MCPRGEGEYCCECTFIANFARLEYRVTNNLQNVYLRKMQTFAHGNYLHMFFTTRIEANPVAVKKMAPLVGSAPLLKT